MTDRPNTSTRNQGPQENNANVTNTRAARSRIIIPALAAAAMIAGGATALLHGDEADSPPVLGRDWTMVRYEDDNHIIPRFGMSAIEHEGRLYYIGGYGEHRWRNDIWTTEDGTSWTRLVENAEWAPRAFFGLVTLENNMYIVGGTGHDLYNDVWRSGSGTEWTRMPDAPWPERSHHGTVSHNGKIYVLGGHGLHERLNDVWATSDGESWELLTESAPWTARSHLAAVSHGDHIYVMGGARWIEESDSYEYFNDVWRSTDGRQWESVTVNADWTPRFSPGVLSHKGYLWVIGGDDAPDTTSIRRDVWRSRDGAEWELTTYPTRWSRVIFAGIFVYDDKIWVMAGVNYGGGPFDPGNRIYYSEGEVD